MLQGCSSGSGGTVSPPEGDNNAGGGDHAGITDGRRGELIDGRLTKGRHSSFRRNPGIKLCGFSVFTR